jgi:RNA polymerase sigma-70 factor (ECF subfamily)
MFGLGGEIEQLICETHLNAYNHLRRMRNRQSYRVWLITAMIRNCRAKMRTMSEPVGIAPDPSILAMRSSCHYSERVSSSLFVDSRLENQLDQLPVSQRAVFVLHKVEGYTMRETAKLLNTSEHKIAAAMDQLNISLRKASRSWHYHIDVYSFDSHSIESIVSQVIARIDSRLLHPLALAPRA